MEYSRVICTFTTLCKHPGEHGVSCIFIVPGAIFHGHSALSQFSRISRECSMTTMISLIQIIMCSLNLCQFQGPDGMAALSGVLYLCCEGAGTVVSLDSSFSMVIECSGLDSPEGICLMPGGEILVTEDAIGGSILMISSGEARVIASDLACPEGVACDQTGAIWFTTGGFEAGELLTSLWRVQNGQRERVCSLPSVFSFSDLEIASDGMVYICSESSGLFGSVSVFSFDPETGVLAPFAVGVQACEGICLTNGGFPMYLAAEQGTVYSADSSGTCTVVCEVRGTIEDVVLMDGELFVSEDSSGSVIRVLP